MIVYRFIYVSKYMYSTGRPWTLSRHPFYMLISVSRRIKSGGYELFFPRYYIIYFIFFLQTGRRRRPTAAGACALDTHVHEQKEYRFMFCTGCLIENEHYCGIIIYTYVYLYSHKLSQ